MSSRDAEQIAFERTYPGVTARKVRISPTGFEFECDGTAEALISTGLISPQMADRMKGVSSQICFGPRSKRKENYCAFYTQLRYRSEGGRLTETLSMRRWTLYDEQHSRAAIDFCLAIGVTPPSQTEIDAAIQETAAAIEALAAELRATSDKGGPARRRGRKLWTCDGVLITVDWDAIRERVELARVEARAS